MDEQPAIGATADVLARLEALTARLDEQAAEIERLRAQVSSPNAAPVAAVTRSTTNRRTLLTRLLGATAAATVLAVASETRTVGAYARGDFLGTGVQSYGVAAMPNNIDPHIRATVNRQQADWHLEYGRLLDAAGSHLYCRRSPCPAVPYPIPSAY